MSSQNVELNRLKDFLKRYTLRQKQLDNLRYQEFRATFLRIAAGLQSINKLGKELERVKANRFNIFSVLGVSSLEIKTHSALLADLLSPKGSHGQGDLFLSLFLTLPPLKFNGSHIIGDDWIVQRDKITAFGNMDLFLAAPNRKQCIIIENKIDAGDQPGQMSRYFRWLKASPYDVNVSRLIYLTPEGHLPSVMGLTVNEKEDIEAKLYLTLLSYKSDIIPLLKKALHNISASRLREILHQYCEIFVNSDE